MTRGAVPRGYTVRAVRVAICNCMGWVVVAGRGRVLRADEVLS